MPIQVGIDLVRAEEVRRSITAHGERYLKRIYTDGERHDCQSDPARLAAHFAAKEATMKALGRADEPLPWRSIAVVRDGTGGSRIELSGAAAALARRSRVRRLDLSLTHNRSLATAVVLAELDADA
jgi:holo-[acyl-carrier protein] synthase